MTDEYEHQSEWRDKCRKESFGQIGEVWITDVTDYESLKLNGPIQTVDLKSIKDFKEPPVQTFTLTFKAND